MEFTKRTTSITESIRKNENEILWSNETKVKETAKTKQTNQEEERFWIRGKPSSRNSSKSKNH